MTDKYRKDHRTEKEFRRDIADGSRIEQEIISVWTKKHLKNAAYSDHGCDNSGQYLDFTDVNSNADFEVEGIGLVEVKFSLPLIKKYFHLKISQVISIIKQGAYILFVNGWNTEQPLFILISPEQLKLIKKWCEIVSWQGFGGKLSYRIPIEFFDSWESL